MKPVSLPLEPKVRVGSVVRKFTKSSFLCVKCHRGIKVEIESENLTRVTEETCQVKEALTYSLTLCVVAPWFKTGKDARASTRKHNHNIERIHIIYCHILRHKLEHELTELSIELSVPPSFLVNRYRENKKWKGLVNSLKSLFSHSGSILQSRFGK